MHLLWQLIVTITLLALGNKLQVQTFGGSKISMAEDDEALEPLKIVPPDSVDDDEEDYIEQPLEIVPPKPDELVKMSTRAKLSRVKNNNKVCMPHNNC